MGSIELALLMLIQVLADALCLVQQAWPVSLALVTGSALLLALTPLAYVLCACVAETRDLPGPLRLHFQALSTDSARGRCPVCRCSGPGDWVACPDCDTPHHADCLAYVGGCAIYGCRARPFAGQRYLLV